MRVENNEDVTFIFFPKILTKLKPFLQTRFTLASTNIKMFRDAYSNL